MLLEGLPELCDGHTLRFAAALPQQLLVTREITAGEGDPSSPRRSRDARVIGRPHAARSGPLELIACLWFPSPPDLPAALDPAADLGSRHLLVQRLVHLDPAVRAELLERGEQRLALGLR